MDTVDIEAVCEQYRAPAPDVFDASEWVVLFVEACAPAVCAHISVAQGSAFGKDELRARDFEDAADELADKISMVLAGEYGRVLDLTWLVGQYGAAMSRILQREVRWTPTSCAPELAGPSAAKKYRTGEACARAVRLLHQFARRVEAGDRHLRP